MSERQSVEATYDSRDTGMPFHVTAMVGNKTITFRDPLPDPFVRATIRVSLWDAVRAFLQRRQIVVTVIVGGDPKVVNDVLELDYNTLIPGSTRREDWNQHVSDRLAMIARTEDEAES
jgi:hypothetical protein